MKTPLLIIAIAILLIPSGLAQTWTFTETFDGDPATPSQSMLPKTFDYVATHRSHPSEPDGTDAAGSYGTFPADHGDDCSPPDNQHQASTTHRSNTAIPDQSFFICKNHMMTSMGEVSGYSVTAMYPRMEFDISNGMTIEFDVSLFDDHSRNWWEILIVPRDQLKLGAAVHWLPIDESYPADHIVLSFTDQMKRSIGVSKGITPGQDDNIVSEGDWRTWGEWIAPGDPALKDRKIRRPQRIEITKNKITWKIMLPNGTYDDYSVDVPGGLPFNRGVVMIKTHAYTPNKDSVHHHHTFHWDNLKIAAPIARTWEGFESATVVNLANNGNRPIGGTYTDTISLPHVGNNPRLIGQVAGGFIGQVQLSINGNPTILVQPIDTTCSIGGWSSFSIPIPHSHLKTGANTLKWTVGPRPSCATDPGWPWDGFSVKAQEIQFDTATLLPPPPAPSPSPLPPPPATPPGPTPGPTPTPTPTPIPIPSGAFAAQYFDNIDFTTLKVVRTDAAIDFDWGSGSPDATIGADTFSAIWKGNFNFDASAYTFSATTDDGMRVLVDGTPIIEGNIDQPATTYTGTATLSAGVHQIEVRYYENGGNALAKVSWSKQTTTTPPAPLPPPPTPPPSVTPPPPTVPPSVTCEVRMRVNGVLKWVKLGATSPLRSELCV